MPPTSKNLLALGTACLALTGCAETLTAPPRVGPVDLAQPWQTANAANLGVDDAGLGRAAERADALERVQSLLVVRQGRLVMERYDDGFGRGDRADVRSVTKSVVSLLTGIALDRGELPGLDATVGDLLPDRVAVVPEAQRGITLRHLLTMTGGWDWDESTAAGYNDWVSSGEHIGYLLARPLANEPGARFSYNSAAVHLLGVILEEAVGPLPAYAQEHLFGPSGIGGAEWEPLGLGRVNGGSGIDLRPRDLARIGQLMVQEGRSGDRQVLSSGWVDAATTPAAWRSTSGPLELSYGYLWWTDEANDAYFAWGFGGQFIYVAPARDLVVVATTRWRPRAGDPFPENIAMDVLALIIEEIVPAAPPV